tara:strand:- start:25 stop:240 length:216 start_codon:yes stop_codon:yes gene_type:complete
MKIGSLVRTGSGMYAYEGVLAIVIGRQAPRAVALRVVSVDGWTLAKAKVGDVIYASGFDYDELEVISESRS